MTEETFLKAMDIMRDRDRHYERIATAKRMMEDGDGFKKVNANFKYLSPNLEKDIIDYIKKALERFIATEECCIEICNDQLEQL